MSKGYITDYAVKIKPSEKLFNFISSLHNVQTMPENVIKIYQALSNDKRKIDVFRENIPTQKYSASELEILKNINSNEKDQITESIIFKGIDSGNDDSDEIQTIGPMKKISGENKSKTQKKKSKEEARRKERSKLTLSLVDLKWLNKILVEKRQKDNTTGLYLHELLEGCKMILPKNDTIPRNPVLEARCVELRRQQEAQEYRNMTKDVDQTRKHLPEDTIAYQLKSMDRQLIAVLQFIFSVAAGFAFGFIGIELLIGNLDFGFRLLLGIIFALIIALAEIYFLAQKLSEYDEIIDEMPKSAKKAHQD